MKKLGLILGLLLSGCATTQSSQSNLAAAIINCGASKIDADLVAKSIECIKAANDGSVNECIPPALALGKEELACILQATAQSK